MRAIPDRMYPIERWEDLAGLLGADAVLDVRGRSRTLAEARRVVPAYYFPIRSEPELRTKLADLQAQPPEAPGAERGDAEPTGEAGAPTDCWS